MNTPILITGADRSGSSIVAEVFSMCGAFTGNVNKMNENIEVKALHHFYIDRKSDGCFMLDLSKTHFKDNWRSLFFQKFTLEGMHGKDIPMYKDSAICQTWQLWEHAFPNAKWIIVRRRTGDIIQSCINTAYMQRFKKESNRKMVNVSSEEKGWLWWVHQYEEKFKQIIETNPNNFRIIWPERMATNDFTQMKEAVEWAGLQWNEQVEVKIPQLLRKPE